MFTIDIKRLSTETEEQFLWRIGQLIDCGKIASWESANEAINKELLGDDEEHYRTESAWRKPYQAAKRYYNGCFSKMESEEYQNKIDELNRELQRNTIKFRDQRRAWNKQNYDNSRFAETMEIMEEIIPTIGKSEFEVHEIPSINGSTDLLCTIADLHIGQTFKSFWGEYNSDIAKQELEKYLNDILKIAETHNSSKIHVASIGDQINGLIHQTIQITNKENVIEQVKIAIEYIASFCYELTKHFEHVYFYNINGNHSRLNPNKDNAVKDERLDDLIGWTVCKLLNHIENFHDLSFQKIDSTIGEAIIRNKHYMLLHGDMDSITKTGIGNLVTMLGFCPDYIVCGHKHSPMMCEVNGIQAYQSGTFAPSGDDYTISKRLNGKPSQTVLVCDEKGVRCCYNVKLN